MESHDVRRALVRGAVVAGLHAALLPLGALVFDHLDLRPVLVLSTGQAVLFGLFAGLLAVPIALVESHRAKKPRSVRGDFGTAALVFIGITVLLALGALQAIYTREILAGRPFTSAAQRVLAQMRDEDAPGYVLACAAGALPVAVTTLLRILGAPLFSQSFASLIVAMTISMPLLAFLSAVPDNEVPVHALGAWVIAAALLLGPLATFSDRIATRFFGDS